ncbi:MAG: YifB family Mg chelatase-like AAA ATPase [Candidatus Spechtbacterales bacterium]|nr:YifB family Mg chelatase-like AAA ATPase [Candidatus Spechtbacterales bacterium]
MPSKLYSLTFRGIDTQTIEIETDVSNGLHSFSIVGLGDKAVMESKERISSALKNNNLKPPRSFSRRVTVNLAPADVKKEGGIYDLAIAIGFLIDSEQIKPSQEILANTLIMGELGLDGEIRSIKGALLGALHAKANNYSTLIVPFKNQKEAALVKEVDVIALSSIREVIDYLEGKEVKIKNHSVIGQKKDERKLSLDNDFSLIRGQKNAKRALEIAAAGGHNVMFKGPPGSGKTLLAKSTTTILPSMPYEEALEVTKIESVIGGISYDMPLVSKRPFRAPHHTSSESAIIGGGAKLMPGEITRAHRGVLFMDEFPEFHRDVLESLRQPLEEGSILVARARGMVEYPANFILIAAANPCPCGYYGDKSNECTCSMGSVIRYQRKLSGPIADRIDLHVHVPRQSHKKISSNNLSESSESIRERVERARKIQEKRFQNENILLNSEMKLSHIKKYCTLTQKNEEMLGKSIDKYKLSARAYHSILKISRTVADIRESENIEWKDVSLALQYAKRDVSII